MPRILRPLTRAVTWTRWLHLLVAAVIPLVVAFAHPGFVGLTWIDWVIVAVQPIPLLLLVAMLPATRRAEGLQARLMLFPGPHARGADGSPDDHGQGGDGLRHARGGDGLPDDGTGITTAPSASWSDRLRTGLWLVLRLELGFLVGVASNLGGGLFLACLGAAFGDPGVAQVLRLPGTGWWYGLLALVDVLVLLAVVTAAGELAARAAQRLLGPSPRERLAELEERTERLLERNRIARELHDSIGHALTLAVVQAGAARAAGNREFTDRALDAIEETGRAALEDLERVLVVLREPARPAGPRPGLGEAGRLLESARSSGARVEAEVTGPLERVPGPVSREGYRMLQEALTNALRHAGPVPVRVRIAVEEARLRLDVRNPLPLEGAGAAVRGGGSGVRGIRERAALLGGEAGAGAEDGLWVLRVDLPLT
ncbi:sensor histidine kinase [Streptomyces sp. NPDC002640]